MLVVMIPPHSLTTRKKPCKPPSSDLDVLLKVYRPNYLIAARIKECVRFKQAKRKRSLTPDWFHPDGLFKPAANVLIQQAKGQEKYYPP